MDYEETAIYPQIIRLKETRSTNLYLREYLARKHLPEGSVVITESQTAGRGQRGTYWESAPGENLTFSIILYPRQIPANRQFVIARMSAVAVKETLDAYTGDITIKWPNDIYWHHKKICGMLIENDLSAQQLHSSIIGIGLNLNQTRFTGNAPNPVSLRQITGKAYDKEDLFHCLMQRFYARYLQLLQEKEDDICRAYHASLYRREGFFSYCDSGGLFEARIREIDAMGHLVLQLRDGEIRRYAFKEVAYR
ncbi:MAG: biotin--[acetyl-CoA-carboxylase] ligase [Tannerellaceae bacterium]|jgi:BirA family biotin operon repressor/biotin-[acetyl-CoA-carboxylase] ligase|nr:biotin--[acetyl-CoA-carboxylase] ligase [Tannerellaceae bacterium]